MIALVQSRHPARNPKQQYKTDGGFKVRLVEPIITGNTLR